MQHKMLISLANKPAKQNKKLLNCDIKSHLQEVEGHTIRARAETRVLKVGGMRCALYLRVAAAPEVGGKVARMK